MTRRAVLLAAVGILAGILGSRASITRAAEEAENLEQHVKAAFLYKFASYVDWPVSSFARPDVPVTIAVVGAEPVAAALRQMVTGRTVNDRPVVVKRLKAGESLAGAHILFIGEAEGARVQQLALNAQARSILTVTESEGALAQGSVINFVVSDRRVRFEISLESAEKSGLRLSSRLLSLARHVRKGNP